MEIRFVGQHYFLCIAIKKTKNMECKIFISHSNLDQKVATTLADFLCYGLGVASDHIFCSSKEDAGIPIGVDFNKYIKEKITESADFFTIAIISNAYYNSKYCLYELGAAWGLSKKDDNIIPFLIGGMNHGDPKDFIKYKQAIIGHEEKDINRLADRIRATTEIERNNVSTTQFEKERKKLIEIIEADNENRKKALKGIKSAGQPNLGIKLVAFDFDGTILQGPKYRHSWQSIWRYLNYEDNIRKELQEKHKSDHKAYNFQDWCNECVRYFKEAGFKREHVKKIIDYGGLKLATNFDDVVRVLHAFGIKMIIISGGIDTFIEETIDEEILALIDQVVVNKAQYNKDGTIESVTAFQNQESDPVGKIKALDEYCSRNNISREQVAYVGDQVNDMDILQVVGKPIVYPANRSGYNLREKQLNFDLIHEDSIVHILPSILGIQAS